MNKNNLYESVLSPLALFLVLESRKKDSFFQPYFSVLPPSEFEFVPGLFEDCEPIDDKELETKFGYIRRQIQKFRE